jgi:Probable cobalt transporter subunit (CbtA)
MVRNLLICGLLAGACAGLLASGFAQVAGEPAVEQAISVEEAHSAPAGHEAGAHAEVAPVSRSVQRSVGLPVAAIVYGLGMGGLFALVFAAAYGRVGAMSPARTALWLAGAAFVVVFLVPFLKYPSNPPAVGHAETIGERTTLYFTMLAISLLAAVAAVRVRSILARRLDAGPATLCAVAAFVAIVVAGGIALPGVNEVPVGFPADTLWDFRKATVGTQAVLWATVGLVFAATAPRVLAGRPIWQR